jgi:aspartate kinase
VSALNVDGKIVVLKVGGSVLTGAKSYRRVGLYLKKRIAEKPEEKLVVVVSARQDTTNVLEKHARRIVSSASVRTLDLLWATGELRSVALLTLYLQKLQVPSVGFNVHETGLEYALEGHSGSARPNFVATRLRAALCERSVVVVPGFLATRWDGAMVSLGRGGSDLSAVLLAAGLPAIRCELIKDVPGYFVEDPRENAHAQHLPVISFETAMRMADRGCELVQPRALAVAAEARLALVIRSMDDRAPFTAICESEKTGQVECCDEHVAARA